MPATLVLRNAGLRRVLVSETGVVAAQAAVEVAVAVFAFTVGGAGLLGVTLAAQFIGVGLTRPLVGLWLDGRAPMTELRVGAAAVVLGPTLAVIGLIRAAMGTADGPARVHELSSTTFLRALGITGSSSWSVVGR